MTTTIKRRFAAIDLGQVHYYTAGEAHADNGKRPAVLMHASPFAARTLNPLTAQLGQSRWALAPDNLGQGDSCPPAADNPDIGYFGDAMVRLLDSLKIDRADLYGTHTGAHTAMDVAIRYPDRVGKLILDGIGLPPRELKDDYIAHLRETPPYDYTGSQYLWAFHVIKDMFIWFPYYRRDAAHRRNRDVPAADDLHDRTLDLLKNLFSYHKAYIAAFDNNENGKRFPDIQVPTLLTAAEGDISGAAMGAVAKMIPDCTKKNYPPGVQPGDVGPAAAMFVDWLDGA
ncbi:MAG: alpha/beta hydrolase [Alphaproteobacteria bacterium]